jgi:GTP cyclohydrolase I
MNKRILDRAEVMAAASKLGRRIARYAQERDRTIEIFGVPRGGINAACYVVASCPMSAMVTYDINTADIIVDDLIDSGKTAKKYGDSGLPFFALFNKKEMKTNDWLVFPWEIENEQEGPTDAVTRLLQHIGEDVTRGGLIDTPTRVIKAWSEWAGGYNVDIPKLFKTFEDGAENCDEMIVVKNIPFYSHCEHHLAPFFGSATLAYIPDGRIVGLSKLNRLVKALSQRLQVQERLTCQIADAMQEHLKPLGVAVKLHARHLCMESRGVCQSGHETHTTALRGVFKTQPETRAEFMMQ